MLMPSLGHHTMQEQGGKWDKVGPVGFGNFKVVLTLLTKAVVVQIKISIIEVGEPSLQRLLSKRCLDLSGRQSLILVFQMDFHELEHLKIPHHLLRKSLWGLWAALARWSQPCLVKRFFESASLVPSLRSRICYCLTELLQMGWLTHWVWSNWNCKKRLKASQLITNHYYLKCNGMLSVNGWNSGMVMCRSATCRSGIGGKQIVRWQTGQGNDANRRTNAQRQIR